MWLGFKHFTITRWYLGSLLPRLNSLHKQPTIHKVTDMSPIKMSYLILFPGHNHLLTINTDDPTLDDCLNASEVDN